MAVDLNRALTLRQRTTTPPSIGTSNTNSSDNNMRVLAKVATDMLNKFFGDMGDANKEVGDRKEAKNDIKKSQETTQAKTDEAVTQINTQIETSKAFLDTSLKQIDENNEKKKEIEEKVKEQNDIVEKAQKYLNGEDTSSFGSRAEAIQALTGAKDAIVNLSMEASGLVLAIQAEADMAKAAQETAEQQKQEFSEFAQKTEQDLKTNVEQSQNEKAADQNLDTEGQTAVAEGNEKIAQADAMKAANPTGALSFEADRLEQEGKEEVDKGTTLQDGVGPLIPDLDNLIAEANNAVQSLITSWGSIGNESDGVITGWGSANENLTQLSDSTQNGADATETAVEALDEDIAMVESAPVGDEDDAKNPEGAEGDKKAKGKDNSYQYKFTFDTEKIRDVFTA